MSVSMLKTNRMAPLSAVVGAVATKTSETGTKTSTRAKAKRAIRPTKSTKAITAKAAEPMMAPRQPHKSAQAQMAGTNLPQHPSADPANARPPEQNQRARPEDNSAQPCTSDILKTGRPRKWAACFFYLHTASAIRRRTSTTSGLVLYIFSTVTS